MTKTVFAATTVDDYSGLFRALRTASTNPASPTQIVIGNGFSCPSIQFDSGYAEIDLNGNELTMGTATLTVKGNLTVKDSGTSGKISGNSSKVVNIRDGGSFTLKGGSVISSSSTAGSPCVFLADGTFTMSGGEVKATGEHGICVHLETDSAQMIMTGGKITATGTASNSCSVSVSDGSFIQNGGAITGRISGTYTHNGGTNDTYKSITIEKNKDGGTVSASPDTAEAGTQVTITASANTGYAFVGWTDTANLLNNTTSASQTFTMPSNNVTFTANFKGPNSETPPAPEADSKTKNSITLKAVDDCEYKCGQGSWQDSPSFTGLSEDTEYTFYQRYKETEYTYASSASSASIRTLSDTPTNRTVTYVVEHGKWNDGSTGDKTETVADNGHLASIPPVGNEPDANYKAGSWSPSTPTNATEITENTTYTYTYVRQDTVNVYVTFKVKNGSWNDGSKTDVTKHLWRYENEDKALELTAADIPDVGDKPDSGYKAGSWDVDPPVGKNLGNESRNLTYTYSYTEKPTATYTVEVNADPAKSGTVTSSKTSGKTGDEVSIEAEHADGYKFMEWKVIAGGVELADSKKSEKTFNIKNADVEITALFEKDSPVVKTCTISFDANGGKGEMKPQTGDKGETIKLCANDFKRSGYEFKNWNTEADGSGDKYDNKQSVELKGDMTLYAQWKEKDDDDDDDDDDHDEESSPSNQNNTKIPDGCEELRAKLSAAISEAIASGKEKTVTWDKGTSLPYDVMKMLQDNPKVTLEFSYTYQDQKYTVTIPGSRVITNPSIQWYGPVYLYALYGQNQKVTLPAQTSAATGTYMVKSGDTLSAIAKRLKTTVKHLKDVNNIKNVDKIKPGMVLKY